MTSHIEIVRTESVHVSGIAVLNGKDEVWITFGAPWWDLFAWLRWWLTPNPKAWLLVNSKGQGARIRVRAYRAARQYVRAGETLP